MVTRLHIPEHVTLEHLLHQPLHAGYAITVAPAGGESSQPDLSESSACPTSAWPSHLSVVSIPTVLVPGQRLLINSDPGAVYRC